MTEVKPVVEFYVIYDVKADRSHAASRTKKAARQRVKRLNTKFGEGAYDCMPFTEWKKTHYVAPY